MCKVYKELASTCIRYHSLPTLSQHGGIVAGTKYKKIERVGDRMGVMGWGMAEIFV